MDFVAALGPTPTAVLDVFAYHMYSGYGLAGNLADQMMGPAFLEDAKALVRRAADAVRKVAPTMPLVSETAAAWNSMRPTHRQRERILVCVRARARVRVWRPPLPPPPPPSPVCLEADACLPQVPRSSHVCRETGHIAVARQTLVGGNCALVGQNHDWRAPRLLHRCGRRLRRAPTRRAACARAGRDRHRDRRGASCALGACGANGTLARARERRRRARERARRFRRRERRRPGRARGVGPDGQRGRRDEPRRRAER